MMSKSGETDSTASCGSSSGDSGSHNPARGADDDLEGEDIWGHDSQSHDEDTSRKRKSPNLLEDELEQEAQCRSTEELRQLSRLLDNEIRLMKSDLQMIQFESEAQRRKIRENQEKVRINSQPPLLVSNIVEILPPEEQDFGMVARDSAEDGAAMDVSASRHTTSAVIKTSTRETIFLPLPGLVPPDQLRPGDLVGVNKDSYLILEKLPDEHDGRVKRMEVEERPTENYSDVAGCDTQIQELIEAVVLPMTHKDMFDTIGIKPPKGVLLFGPPGTGKTLLARACANHTNAAFFKLAGPELVQMYIGDGAKMIRDAFELAKEKMNKKEGAILFIDEIDAIGTRRYGGDQTGEREVQRTMLELLNQLDGFSPNDMVKVIAATNRPDILDPALVRSGRLDRKIELPLPTEDARIRMFEIHSRKMHVSDAVSFEELARTGDGFNGAQIKAVCVEAGMLALRREASSIGHEDFVEALTIVAAKKKGSLDYFA